MKTLAVSVFVLALAAVAEGPQIPSREAGEAEAEYSHPVLSGSLVSCQSSPKYYLEPAQP